MYQCLSCGGNLKFDIPSQMLSCVYCNSLVNPYDVVKENDAIQKDYFETKIYTCAQCGGEIYSIDNEVASFCSYCGASAILSERISNEKCPNHIITFKVTKEDCKREYNKVMKYAFFCPGKYKNPNFIDGFKGIYIPYWNYSVKQEGEVNLPVTKSHRSGDYIITEHYDMKGYLSSTFSGDVHDASANFYDEISKSLAPFDITDCIDFTPSFLIGFYADAADVDKTMYVADAIKFAEDTNLDRIKNDHLSGYTYNENSRSSVKRWPESDIESVRSAMFPVWFLSYRNKDRVAYAVVNGQTGKVVADMPISICKYILSTLLLTIPLFLLFNLVLVLRPSQLLSWCSILLIVSGILCKNEIKAIYEKENNVGDLGIEWRKYKRRISSVKRENQEEKVKKNLSIIEKYILISSPVLMANRLLDPIYGTSKIIISGTIIAAMVIILIKSFRQCKKINKIGIPFGLIFSVVATIFSSYVSITRPVADIWYYSAVIGILFAIIVNFIYIIKNYNRIAMRKLPQFFRRGGDDDAF